MIIGSNLDQTTHCLAKCRYFVCRHTRMHTKRRQTMCGRYTFCVCVVFVGCNPFGNMLFFLFSFHWHNGTHTIRNPYIDTDTMLAQKQQQNLFPFIDICSSFFFDQDCYYHNIEQLTFGLKGGLCAPVNRIEPHSEHTHTHNTHGHSQRTRTAIHFAESINHRPEWLTNQHVHFASLAVLLANEIEMVR